MACRTADLELDLLARCGFWAENGLAIVSAEAKPTKVGTAKD